MSMTRIPAVAARATALACLASALVLTSPAFAASPLTWSSPEKVDAGGEPTAISCPSESLCVAVDSGGDVVSSTNPTGGAAAWKTVDVDDVVISGISCYATAASTVCAGGDHHGNVVTSGDPTGDAGAWKLTAVAGLTPPVTMYGMSCPSATFCVGTSGGGDEVTSSSPSSGNFTSRHVTSRVGFISCPSASFCAATGDFGHVATTAAPGSGPWTQTDVTGNTDAITGVSCLPAGCVAIDEGAYADVSTNPTGGSSAWTRTSTGTGISAAVSCPSTTLCVAVDSGGATDVSTNALSAAPTWTETKVDTQDSLVAVSCPTVSICFALDAGGRVLVGKADTPPPAPTAPVNTTAPAISGSATPGQTLSCSQGTWSGTEPIAYAYAWTRDGAPVTGAAGSTTYAVGAADEGKAIACTVTASNSVDATSATSAAVSVPPGAAPGHTATTGKASTGSGVAKIAVTCHGTKPCTLGLALTTAGKPKGKLRVAKKRVVKVGSATAKVAAGKKKTLKVRLNATGRKLLKKRHKLRATLVVTLKGSGRIAKQSLTFR
jgi:hypothetical protein